MGGNDKYIIGNFKNDCFDEEQSAMSLHYGNSAYAGQSFSNLPDGRVVKMVWDRWNIYPERFNGQMGVPMEISLNYSDGLYYLCAEPVKELANLIEETKCYNEIELTKGEKVTFDLTDNAQLIRLGGKLPEGGKVDITVFGRTIELDFTKNQIFQDGKSASICSEGDEFDIIAIIDRCSIEIFTDKGRAYLTNISPNTVMDRNLPFLEFESDTDILLGNLKISSLKSIWSE